MSMTTAEAASTLPLVIDGAWPSLTELRSASAETLWSALSDTGLTTPHTLRELVAAERALGTKAAPAPVADAWAARELLGGDFALSHPDAVVVLTLASNITEGIVSSVEFGSIVSLVVAADPATGQVVVYNVASVVETPGMAMPSWSRVTLGSVEHETVVPPTRVDAVFAQVRFALAVRALATAQATHELAISHAQTRVQFGKHIGSYQAVQHRTVNCALEVSIATALVDDAVRLAELEDPTASLALEVAVSHALDRASWIQFEAHHTLAASGFFDLYPAPWLFRRVHADLARIPLFPRRSGSVADEMIATRTNFPNANLGENAEAFRAELRKLFAQWQPEMGSGRQAEISDTVVRGLKENGLITLDWPEEFGGRNASIEERAVLSEEVGYKKLQTGPSLGAATLLGHSIIRYATPEQQQKFLTLIADAQLHFYLGYSEPEVGSDLASVQLTAVRDGDDWILNGTKRWGQAQRAQWGWIAARTDPDATPRHAGISVFLVPLTGLEGFWVEEITSLAGETHAFSHFDNVRVSADALVGEVNGGWKVITAALSEERITMAGLAAGTRGLLDLLMQELELRDRIPAEGSAERHALGRVATRLQASRVLTNRSLLAQASGSEKGAAALEAPLAKILGGESTEEFSKLAVDLLGPDALLDEASEGSIARGLFDYSLRVCLIGTVGGGTGDIQRNIIARSLGLPRD
jgi:alkylation response protein AidB-like acyl-CoA dehydrogenase